MAGASNRASTLTSGSADVNSSSGERRNLWTSMLESVASGKKLPEKNLLVLGGTPESQREFLESLSQSPDSKPKFGQQSPVANSFALGYTYYDVLDADQDDTLARVSLYLLSQPCLEFAPLISPLLSPETVPNTALVILLDWSQPHLWLRQLWKWIQVLEQVMGQVTAEARNAMEEVMMLWKERGRGGSSVNLDGTQTATSAGADSDGLLPLGPGEWTEPLGLPLCVVCQNAQKIEFLERNKGWKEPDFDLVLQYLRTVLLRHGGSLIYTSPNTPSQLPVLMHSTLGITSLLKRQPLKHNVIDRDKIVVASNWDSWGKIRILGGSFDAELVSEGWEEDIKLPPGAQPPSAETQDADADAEHPEAHQNGDARNSSAIALYEGWCRDPDGGGLAVVESAMDDGSTISIPSVDTQEFLERQQKILEAFKAKAAAAARGSDVGAAPVTPKRNDGLSDVHEHIGPVQFNMGGIQVDADDMLQRLKDRNARSASPPADQPQELPSGNMSKDYDNEQLQSFFSGLMNRSTGSDGARPS